MRRRRYAWRRLSAIPASHCPGLQGLIEAHGVNWYRVYMCVYLGGGTVICKQKTNGKYGRNLLDSSVELAANQGHFRCTTGQAEAQMLELITKT